MRAVIQRVTHAIVTIDGSVHGKIDQGYLILLGVCEEDSMEDVEWLKGSPPAADIMQSPNHITVAAAKIIAKISRCKALRSLNTNQRTKLIIAKANAIRKYII